MIKFYVIILATVEKFFSSLLPIFKVMSFKAELLNVIVCIF